MKITGKVTNDDSFEFALEESGTTHFVTIDRSMMKTAGERALVQAIAHELTHAARQATMQAAIGILDAKLGPHATITAPGSNEKS